MVKILSENTLSTTISVAAGQVAIRRTGRARGGRRVHRRDPERTRGSLPRPTSQAAADPIRRARGCVVLGGSDHDRRGHWRFRARLVTAALLVDTPLVLWARIAPERLSGGERRALDDARSCYISAVSLWEIAILMALGRIAHD